VSTCISTFPSKDSYLFSKKKECDNILCKWQMFFANSLKKSHYFLNFKDKKQKVIKPTYAKGSSWLPIIGFTNLLCACFTYITTGYTLLENTNRDSSSTYPPAAYVVKLKFKPKNTSSWNMTCMTPPCDHATLSLTALFISSQTTLEHLALTTVKVLLQHDSLE